MDATKTDAMTVGARPYAAATTFKLTSPATGEVVGLAPTIIADPDNGDALVEEDQFGPALPIIKFSNIDEVIERANDKEKRLGGSVWINRHGMIQPNAPFGGVRKYGLGVGFGEEGMEEFTDIQVIFS